MKHLIILAAILSVLTGCKKETAEGFKVHRIHEGKHFSHNLPGTLTKDYLEFECYFDSSAIYQTVVPQNQGDINKLMGFSDCNGLHQKNSARFGWRWFGGNLQIHAYVYNDGERSSMFITNIEIGVVYKFRIDLWEDRYLFSVDGNYVDMPRTGKCETGVYYMLYPYFGGDEAAPHEIQIMIRENKER